MPRLFLATLAFILAAGVSPARAGAPDPDKPGSPVSPDVVTATQPTGAVAPQRTDPVASDQDLKRPISRIFQDIGSDVAHLATRKSLFFIGAGAIGAAAVHPLDEKIAVAPGQEWSGWSEFFDPGSRIGNSAYLFGGAVFTYAYGTMTDRPRAAHVGRDIIRSVATSEVVVQALKLSVKRERPDLSGNNSFPSGHSADTFAAAVVFQRHLGVKWAVPTYLVATYVAVSRLHENRHHLSDVVMGAGLGIASGMSTTRHATESWAFAPVAVPGGAALMVTRIK